MSTAIEHPPLHQIPEPANPPPAGDESGQPDKFGHPRQQLESEICDVLQRQGQIELSYTAAVDRLCLLIEIEIGRFFHSRCTSLDSTARHYLYEHAWRSNRAMAASLDQFVRFQVQRLFDQWLPAFESSVSRAFQDASATFLRLTSENLVRTRLGQSETLNQSTRIPEEASRCVRSSSSSNLDMLSQPPPWLRWPGPLFRRLLLKKLLKWAVLYTDLKQRSVAQELTAQITGAAQALIHGVRARVRGDLALLDAANRPACGSGASPFLETTDGALRVPRATS